MILTVVYIPESSTEFYFTAFSTDHFKTETLLLSFEVEQVLLVIFSHVVLQTGWFQCWHQRFLVIQCLIFKEKRAARGERQADILINYCSTSVISLNFGVAINKKNSLLDSRRDVLLTLAVCCFVLLYVTPGVSADTLLESWQ